MNEDNRMFALDGRVIAITGGLGQLGRAYARALLKHGCKVALVDPFDGEAPGGPDAQDRVMLVKADVTSRDQLDSALAQIKDRWGVPHGLINNAALDSPPDAPQEETGPFETYPEESWDQVMSVNAKGVFLSCQVFGSAMAEAGRGSIINIGSIYGVVSPDQTIYDFRRKKGETFFKPVAYSASKSALYNFTRYLATYWGGKGVRVNIMTIAGVFNDQPQEFLDAYCPKVPMGRMADEDEYNGAVIFLLSDASSYMTGGNLVLDGGWTAW